MTGPIQVQWNQQKLTPSSEAALTWLKLLRLLHERPGHANRQPRMSRLVVRPAVPIAKIIDPDKESSRDAVALAVVQHHFKKPPPQRSRRRRHDLVTRSRNIDRDSIHHSMLNHLIQVVRWLLVIRQDAGLPDAARSAVLCLARQLEALAEQIRELDRRLLAWHRQDQASQRLASIPGVGILTATALSASVPDPSVFRSGRQFAAFLGLVPRQNSSGGKERLGRISKMGDRYLRKLLVVGATSVLRRAGSNPSATGAWVRSLRQRKPARVTTVAIANKTARIAWATLARGDVYRTATPT